jgi:hypothetical protein
MRDSVSFGNVGIIFYVVSIVPDLDVRTVQELIATTSKPGQMNTASSYVRASERKYAACKGSGGLRR